MQRMKEYKYLPRVNSPKELKSLTGRELPAYCAEARDFMVEEVTRHGGHLASNLGITELTVAIHRVFDAPHDHIIFDVGHQAYVHKMITGRRDAFDTLRTPGGLSGFTLRRESEYDPFGAGHSSTSLSAALGFAEADKLSGSDAYTVCVMGDGAFTGGMIHEAMNNCKPDMHLIIILNENRMSISRTRGAFASYLSRIRVSRGYARFKKTTKSALAHVPLIGKPLTRFLEKIRDLLKKIFYRENLFEQLGFSYVGPVNGNDCKKVEEKLRLAKDTGKTCVVHVCTKKGKGYAPAEKSPDKYHSVHPGKTECETFNRVFCDELIKCAERDKKIVAVTAAMGLGTGLRPFEERFPERYFDVGIAEEHAVTFSAGLAADGIKPFVAIYSTFLQRAYDNIIHDVALQGLPVRFIIDRAGLASEDGATHHGIFDVAFLSEIPGMHIAAPATFGSLRAAVNEAAVADFPLAIRYTNTAESSRIVREFYPDGGYDGFGVRANYSASAVPENVIITYGRITDSALSAADILATSGRPCGVLLLERLAPYDRLAESVIPLICGARHVRFVEEGIKNGGAGMILGSVLTERSALIGVDYRILAIDGTFVSPTEPTDIYDFAGLSPCRIVASFDE